MNDPWADPPPRITAHQIHRIVGLIADYTEAEANGLIHTLTPRATGPCDVCGGVGSNHTSLCPTRGSD